MANKYDVSKLILRLGILFSIVLKNSDGIKEAVNNTIPKGTFSSNQDSHQGCQLVSGHPLDPLSIVEIQETTQIIKSLQPTWNYWTFNTVYLKEPPKAELLPYYLTNTDPPAGVIPRKAFAIVFEGITGYVFEAVVNLDSREVESWVQQPITSQPIVSVDEANRVVLFAKYSSEVRAKYAEFGYTDSELIYPSIWTLGYMGDKPEYMGKRLLFVYFYVRLFPEDSSYAHPLPFHAIVDVTNLKILEIPNLPNHADFDIDNPEGLEVPKESFQYDQNLLGGENYIRKDVKPLQITMPEGPSYTVQGNKVLWQKFSMRVGFNSREGLVIHHINYNDNGTVRPIVYRASISEMIVPYGDPRPPFHQKTIFDEGEFGMGNTAVELRAGEDCIGSVYFFDGHTVKDDGSVRIIPNTICIQEHDNGVLWKHDDEWTQKSHIARSRKLSISFISRVENYDYIFYWNFYQDASIQLEIKLTGILNTNMLAVGSPPTGHTLQITPQLNAQFHQHMFAARLDIDIDGVENSASSVEFVAQDNPTGSYENPYGTGIVAKVTELTTAGYARTLTSPLSGKVWKFSNPNKLNTQTGSNVAWKLIPGNGPRLLMQMDSPVRRRAGFADYDMWVTRFDDDQFFAAGDYIGQNNAEGLPKWVSENQGASIVNTDIVLWHVFGVSHFPRIEDWPIMPAETCGFWFKPVGFFTQNPAMDVPDLNTE